MTQANLPLDSTSPLAVDVRKASLVYNPLQAPVHALSEVDLTIQPGEFVSLIGPSGCGKTTLLRVIADLQDIAGRSVLVSGESTH